MNCCAPTLEPLAHSARDGAQEQTYREHAGNVFREATLFARAAAALSPKWCDSFVAAVERAAAYHDLGKLDELFQEVLRHNRKNKHGFNHVEAGTAHLLRLKQFEAAFTAYSHHIGLQSVPKEKAKFGNGQNLVFRDTGELEGLGQGNEPTSILEATCISITAYSIPFCLSPINTSPVWFAASLCHASWTLTTATPRGTTGTSEMSPARICARQSGSLGWTNTLPASRQRIRR